MSSSGSPRPSPRTGGGVSRRDAMLDAAAKLFSTRGYVDTGIDDIGEAVGVTGPAVYRHFESKQALLIAVLDRAVEHSTAIVPRVHAEATSPDDALVRLVEHTVAACIADRELTAIYWQESRNLPAEPRQRFERVQRKLIDEYATHPARRAPRALTERGAHGGVRRERTHAIRRQPREQARRSPICSACSRPWRTPRSGLRTPNPEPSG